MSRQVQTPAETRDRILDTAESLFSDHGFRDVSLRRITREAEVNIAAVNYHFGSKEALIAEVLTRVVNPINRERLSLLDAAEAAHGKDPVPLEEILAALHRPVVSQMKESGHQTPVYLKLAGRCLAEPTENFSDKLVTMFQTMIRRFLAATQKSLPSLSEADIFWGMHFSFGTMVYALTHGDRVALFSEGSIRGTDPEDTLERLIEFSAAGLRARVSSSSQAPSSRTRKSSAILPALAVLLGLTSCKTKSAPNALDHTSIKVPAHWVAGPTNRPSHAPDHYWVENFGDPHLNDYVAAVLANNKDLKAAQARLQAAAATARIVGADLYPQINGGFSSSRTLQNFIGFPFPGAQQSVISTRNNQFGLSLNLQWEIDLWGRIRAAESAALADFEASEFDRATAELSLAGQAVKAWFSLAEALDQEELTRRTIQVFSETEKLIRDRFEMGIEENGRNFASELLLSESDVARARENLNTELELAERTSRQLEVLAGTYPAAQAGKTATLSELPGKVPTGLPATLLDRRPDLAAAERRIASADKSLLEAKRALLPALSLTGTYGTATEDIADLLDGDFSIWSIAANAAQPILQGGRLRANVSRREAELELAAAEFEQAALTAFAEVENALAAEKFLRNRVNALRESSELNLKAYYRAREEFENGTGDILTVLSAQERAFTTRSQLITLRRLLLDNRVDLYLALGGSFKPHEIPAAEKVPES
ncbi:MAG: efflux transporter outer membrane subunit [Verrucomicrobiota bacterium]